MSKYYSGIGSRSVPSKVANIMTYLAVVLEESGYILRSGGAGGADSAFELGVSSPDNKDIYLPHKGFEKNTSKLFLSNISRGLVDEAQEIAYTIHPLGRNLNPDNRRNPQKAPSRFPLNAHTRNVFQVLGSDLRSPSEFLICYTKDGLASGGSATAINLAKKHNIPVFNLKNVSDVNDLYEYLISLKIKCSEVIKCQT